jgi:RNA polymerase sigma factor (sigma-70 family)
MSTALLAPSATADRAFERLYKRHVHEVYRYVLAVLRNQADAEDATQATFLNAYRAFSRGEEPLKPRNWLLKIAHNECRQRFRAASRRPKEVEWDERTAAPGVDETVPTADEIRTALAHLSFNQRSALVMRELEGRSYAEIGTILDLSVSAVETLLFRARRALREQLEGALTCGETEATLSRRIDGRLPLPEQRALRAHLRECPECATLERKQRARRAAVKRLGVIQLPPSLAGFLGGSGSITGGAIVGSGLVAKAAAVVAAGLVAGGAGQQAMEAIAAQPARTPLPEIGRKLPTTYPASFGAVLAPGTPAAAQPSASTATSSPAASRTTRRVRDGVRAALQRPGAANDSKEESGAAGPSGPPSAAPGQAQPESPLQPVPMQPPAAPQPVQNAVETAQNVVNSVPVPPVPAAGPQAPAAPPPVPVEVPRVVVPTPPLPPPPPLP